MTPEDFTVALLADRPELVRGLAELRWREWGPEPERPELADWVAVTEREAGRGPGLPVTFVAVDGTGSVLGGVGLAPFDPPGRREVSPWIVGTIVHPESRGRGIGQALMAALERWARATAIPRLWVATGGRAVAFYERCGMAVEGTARTPDGGDATVLVKSL
jgi:GNAT superfamily N-acetyltransferase